MPSRKAIIKAQEQLNANGFPCGTADGFWGPRSQFAVRKFKRAYAGAVPGVWRLRARSGRLTRRTRRCLDALPYLAPHFTTKEFACKHCGRCYVKNGLLRRLEKLRKRHGAITIISGYRCPEHNANVGGAKYSEHVDGAAADVPPKMTVAQVKAMKLFSGIGYQGATGLVRHVDIRHLTGTNMTGGTPEAPTTWPY